MKKLLIAVFIIFTALIPLSMLKASTEIKNKADVVNRNTTTSGLNVYIFDEVIKLNSGGAVDPESSWTTNTLISTITALEKNTQYTISMYYISGSTIGEDTPKIVLTSATSSPVVRHEFYPADSTGMGTMIEKSSMTFTTGSYDVNAIRIQRREGQIYNDWTFKIQIEKGPTSTEWTSSKAPVATLKEDSGSINMWHRQIGNRVYAYMRYGHINTLTNPASYFLTETDPNNNYVLYENAGQFEDFTRTLSNPDPAVYTQFEIYEKNTYTGETTSVFLGNVTQLKSYTFYADGAIYFRDQDNKLIYKLYGLTKAVSMFWSQPTVVNATVQDLPTTTGNPFPDAESNGIYGSVHFNVNPINHELSRTVSYAGNTYQMAKVILDDISFLQNVEKSYYYTKGEDKFMAFFHKDGDFLSGSTAKKWGGFTIWNLTTNEIIVTNRVWVLTYVDVTSDHKAFAYYYMPEIPVEDLLSVALTFQYRIGKKGIGTLWSQQWSEWETKELRLEKDAQSLEAAIPQWTHDVYTASTVALAAGAILTAIPGTQPIGIPLLAIGSIGLATASTGELIARLSGGLNEIEQVIPDTILKNKINKHYSDVAGKEITINLATNKLYKLYLGSYSGSMVNYVEFDESSFTYTEVSWVSNGTVYVMDGEHIFGQFNVDDKYELEKPKDDPGLLPTIDMIIEAVIFIVAAFVVGSVVVILIKQGILTDPKKALVFFIVVSIIALVVYFFYASGFTLKELFESLNTKALKV